MTEETTPQPQPTAIRTSDDITELCTALAKAQSAMGPAQKGSSNPYFNSSYADLPSVIAAVIGPLTENGLSFVQFPSLDDEGVVHLTTRLMHGSGQWMEGKSSAKPKDRGPQSVGSVITYLRRYALQSVCGLGAKDDDGNAGQQFNGWAEEEEGFRVEVGIRLTDYALNYSDIVTWLKLVGRPTPEEMSREDRHKLIEFIGQSDNVEKIGNKLQEGR